MKLKTILCMALALPAIQALGDDDEAPPTPTLLAEWSTKDGQELISVDLAPIIKDKQKSIVNGGFTTLSHASLRLLDDSTRSFPEQDDQTLKELARVRCSVKFDAWEESYELARLDDQPQTAIVKSFDDYKKRCLTPSIRLNALPQTLAQVLAKTGGTLAGWLIFKQTSKEEAAGIKNWLVEQQSGVMQSLFSHMLGELVLAQTSEAWIKVTPRPDKLEDSNHKSSPVRIIKPDAKG